MIKFLFIFLIKTLKIQIRGGEIFYFTQLFIFPFHLIMNHFLLSFILLPNIASHRRQQHIIQSPMRPRCRIRCWIVICQSQCSNVFFITNITLIRSLTYSPNNPNLTLLYRYTSLTCYIARVGILSVSN